MSAGPRTSPLSDSFAGKNVLVTGGGSGIGLGVAAALAARGAMVTICGRSAERLAAAREFLAADGGGPDVRSVVADLSDEAQCAGAVAAAVGEGGLHAVVASAGEPRGQMAPVTRLDLDQWQSVFRNNTVATMLTLKYGARELVRSGGGAFVAIGSISSSMAARFTSPISSAKAAIDQLCRIAASELGPSRVRVNVVRPGLIRVDRQELPDEIAQDFLAAVALPRLGRTSDIASAVTYLVSDEAEWVTGQIITIDGGQSIRRPFDASAWVEPVFGADGLRGVV